MRQQLLKSVATVSAPEQHRWLHRVRRQLGQAPQVGPTAWQSLNAGQKPWLSLPYSSGGASCAAGAPESAAVPLLTASAASQSAGMPRGVAMLLSLPLCPVDPAGAAALLPLLHAAALALALLLGGGGGVSRTAAPAQDMYQQAREVGAAASSPRPRSRGPSRVSGALALSASRCERGPAGGCVSFFHGRGRECSGGQGARACRARRQSV